MNEKPNFVKLMGVLVRSLATPPDRTVESYEKIARAYDGEHWAYLGIGEAPTQFAIYHRPCYQTIMKITRGYREKKPELSLQSEAYVTIAVVEEHCVNLFEQNLHLSPPQLAFNRATWQGANALMSMALSLRPKSIEWMEVDKSWSRAIGIACASIALLRVMREAPDMGYANPGGDLTQDAWDEAFMNRQEAIAGAIIEIVK